jgi:hypothetical protein
VNAALLHTRSKATISCSDAVPQDEHAATEPALLKQLQVEPHAVSRMHPTVSGWSPEATGDHAFASRVRVTTVMSSSWPNATAASEACAASAPEANSVCSRSKLKISPEGVRASSRPSV